MVTSALIQLIVPLMKPLGSLFVLGICLNGDSVVVRDNEELRNAFRNLKPGATIKIAPGEYSGGHYIEGLKDVTIEGQDPKNPPHLQGGANALHASRCENLMLRHLRISGQTGNGLNLDDGGIFDKPVTGILIENVAISDVGPKGNHDGIKCSGLDRLSIRDCTLRNSLRITSRFHFG